VDAYWNDYGERLKDDDEGSDSPQRSIYKALHSVSIDFRRGELTAIIGTVGSGKSALVQAIIKELPVASGRVVRRYKTLAYAAQDPWIMDGTIKENILLGCSFDEKWYQEVVEACCLTLDFQQLRDGDKTLMGDRGVQCRYRDMFSSLFCSSAEHSHFSLAYSYSTINTAAGSALELGLQEPSTRMQMSSLLMTSSVRSMPAQDGFFFRKRL